VEKCVAQELFISFLILLTIFTLKVCLFKPMQVLAFYWLQSVSSIPPHIIYLLINVLINFISFLPFLIYNTFSLSLSLHALCFKEYNLILNTCVMKNMKFRQFKIKKIYRGYTKDMIGQPKYQYHLLANRY